MSKARLVITTWLTENLTVTEIADRYGVHRSWVYRLLARYQQQGEAAFEPGSRRPLTSPNATSHTTIGLILQLRDQLTVAGLDAGADTIGWHLEQHHQIVVSRATIHRVLARHGKVVPAPSKRPKSSYIRFQADQPNQCWQSDFTHYPLTDTTRFPNGVEIITWLDDHSRYALHITAHHRITATIVHATFITTAAEHQFPASTLTDNGMVYTVRFATGKGGRTKLEHELRSRGITQKNGRPGHPTTQGKVERFQATMKKWLRAQPHQPATIDELQTLLDQFRTHYNHHRPHRSLPHHATPAATYAARPKSSPDQTARINDTHDRVRTDRVNKTGTITLRHNGRLHHIGIGRTYAGTYVHILVHDLDILITNTTTGEILRELTLDPTRDYQPTRRPPGPPKNNNGPTKT